MSRYELHGPRYSMAYGVDHAPGIGIFVMVWDRDKGAMPDVDNVVVDLDGLSRPGGVKGDVILKLAEQYEIEFKANEVMANLLHDLADICQDIVDLLGPTLITLPPYTKSDPDSKPS